MRHRSEADAARDNTPAAAYDGLRLVRSNHEKENDPVARPCSLGLCLALPVVAAQGTESEESGPRPNRRGCHTGDPTPRSAGRNWIRTMTAGFPARSGSATSKPSTGWMPTKMDFSPKTSCDRQPGNFEENIAVDCGKWTQTRMETSREANGRAKKRYSTGWMPTMMGC